MCGFFGALFRSSNVLDISQSLKIMHHRGPDYQSIWSSRNNKISFGHARLAIIDLSEAGQQPMKDPSNGNVIIFNGEIYNYLEIRRELESLGIGFRGHSDTETLLLAFGIWGVEVFSRLRGMFALAIYDKDSDSVIVARDPMGIKPLYYGRDRKENLFFASEVRALLPWTGSEVSHKGVAAYLQRGCCPHRELLYKNISEFPAGCWARLRLDHAGFCPVRFWPSSPESILPSTKVSSDTNQKPDKKIRSLLEDAVRSHLISDVPVGCFLSGGMDSSILTALAARETTGKKLTTFSVGFSESTFDESSYAEEVAKSVGTTHHHIELFEGEKLQMVNKAVAAMDLPSIDGINTYMVSQEASRAGFKVVLSGLGADEVFGGYPIFRDFSFIRLLATTPKWARSVTHMLHHGLHLLSDIPADKTGESLAWWWRRIWNGHDLQFLGFDPPSFESDFHPPLIDAMAEISWGEISCYLRDMLLRDSDCMSMAHSLELRVPFLDTPLVDEVLRLPAEVKYDPRFPKSLLLQATKDILPEKSWNRPKMGFSFPMESWMRRPLRDFCRQGFELAQGNLALDSRHAEMIWQRWEKKRFAWPKLWALVVIGHYLNKNCRT